MKLIVGLGNPGSEYRQTRHNAGFMALDKLADRHSFPSPKAKFHAQVNEGSIRGERVMLMQPQTYMNRSGLAVGEAAGFFKLSPADLMVVVDDTALPVGAIRIRSSGSAGGHNGLADIQRALGTDAYPRLRIGIGAPEVEGRKIPQHQYVLSAFTEAQMRKLLVALQRAADALETWIADGLDAAMNRFNVKTDAEPSNN